MPSAVIAGEPEAVAAGAVEGVAGDGVLSPLAAPPAQPHRALTIATDMADLSLAVRIA
jgi:class 3 adenylate cyclase